MRVEYQNTEIKVAIPPSIGVEGISGYEKVKMLAIGIGGFFKFRKYLALENELFHIEKFLGEQTSNAMDSYVEFAYPLTVEQRSMSPIFLQKSVEISQKYAPRLMELQILKELILKSTFCFIVDDNICVSGNGERRFHHVAKINSCDQKIKEVATQKLRSLNIERIRAEHEIFLVSQSAWNILNNLIDQFKSLPNQQTYNQENTYSFLNQTRLKNRSSVLKIVLYSPQSKWAID